MRFRLALVLLLILIVLAGQAGRFLVVDAPAPSEVIIVLAGETTVRPARAVELLRQGLAPRAFLDVQASDVLYGETLTDVAQGYIKSLPEKERVSICTITSLSTFAEVDDVERCVRPLAVHRILIVTSASHTGRALRIFRHRLPQYQFTAGAAQDPTRFGINWWTNREWAKTTFDEWLKLVWFEVVDRWR